MVTRLIDVLVAAVALAVTSPLFAIAALGIRLTSPGPVLYRAQRIGLDGRQFTMLKFRTMQHEAHPGDSAITSAHAARGFPLASLLRRCKVDALPQLLNVLRGAVS